MPDIIQNSQSRWIPQKKQGLLQRFLRRIFFIPQFKFLLHRNKILERTGILLKFQHLPNINYKDSSFYYLKQNKLCNAQQLIKYSPKILKVIFSARNLCILFVSYLIMVIVIACNLLNSILMVWLMNAIASHDIEYAWIWGCMIIASRFTETFLKYQGQLYQQRFEDTAVNITINLLYFKLIQVSLPQNQNKQISFILDQITKQNSQKFLDFQRIINLFGIPVGLGLGGLILWKRFKGLVGLIGLAIMLSLILIKYFFKCIDNRLQRLVNRNTKSRVDTYNLFLKKIRFIKMNTWESFFTINILNFRQMESKFLVLKYIFWSFQEGATKFAYIWMSVLFFYLIRTIFFTQVMVIEMIATIYLFEFLINDCILPLRSSYTAFFSTLGNLKKVQLVLNNSEKRMQRIKLEEQPHSPSIREFVAQKPLFYLRNVYAFTENMTNILKNINLEILEGQVVAIIGPKESGKTALLAALIGGIPYYSGSIQIDGLESYNPDVQISFLDKKTFIFEGSIKQNILIGRKLCDHLYNQVLHYSGLSDDIQKLPEEDDTKIGQQHLNLTVGFKKKLSMARALYSCADVYLFDDFLNQFDVKTYEKLSKLAIIFIMQVQQEFTKKKRKPSILYTTENILSLDHIDQTITMQNGSLREYQFHPENILPNGMLGQRTISVEGVQQQTQDSMAIPSYIDQRVQKENKKPQYRKEDVMYDALPNSVYNKFYTFWKSQWIKIILVSLLNLSSFASYNIIFHYITLHQNTQTRNEAYDYYFFLGIICLVVFIINFGKFSLHSQAIICVNTAIHNETIERLTQAQVSNFDINPQKAMLNRFTDDTQKLDNVFGRVFMDIFERMNGLLIILSIVVYNSSYFIFPALISMMFQMTILYFTYTIFYQAKQLDKAQRFSLNDMLKKSNLGVIQIKMFKQGKWFFQNFQQMTDSCTRSHDIFKQIQAFFDFYNDLICAFTTSLGIVIIISIQTKDYGIFYQNLLLLMLINKVQPQCARQILWLTSEMGVYHRIFQIKDFQPESHLVTALDDQLNNWPSSGLIQFYDVSFRYRPDSELILKQLQFTIKPGQKVICIGKKGAGVSSIAQALLRMAEIDLRGESFIKIDNQNIKQVGLRLLRQSFTYISHNTVFLPGTIRYNLDPFNRFSDDAIMSVLIESNLRDVMNKLSHGLQTQINSVEFSTSGAQRSLLSLARGLLNIKKICILEDSDLTDKQTQSFIHQKILEKFQNSTVIALTQNINMVSKYDKVLVLDSGHLVEFGSPYELLFSKLKFNVGDKYGVTRFAQLFKENGDDKVAQEIIDSAKTRYLLKQ